MTPLPSITIKALPNKKGFIATDQYGNAQVCKTHSDLEEVIDNWEVASKLREEPTDAVKIEMLGYDPIEEIDELIDTLTT